MRVMGVWGSGVVLGDVWIWKDVGGVGIWGRVCLWDVPPVWIVMCGL